MNDKSGIHLYLHCADCLDESEPSDLEVGLTANGDLVVWCARHDKPVLHLDNAGASGTLLELLSQGCDSSGHEDGPAN
jgi:hypothetical protein